MLTKRYVASVLLVTIFLLSKELQAQQSEFSIIGVWKQKGDAVFIEISNDGPMLVATVVRNDWSPGLIGQKLFSGISRKSKRKWVGLGLIPDLGERKELKLSLNKKGHLISYLGGGNARRRLEWRRTNL